MFAAGITRNEPEGLPTEPAVTLAALTTLGALAGHRATVGASR